MTKGSLSSKAASVLFILLLSKVMGFARDMLMAYKFGTSSISDVYTVAVLIPSVFFAVFMSGAMHAYVPYYSRVETPREKTIFFSDVFLFFGCISVLGFCACVFARNTLAHVLAPGFSAEQSAVASRFIGIIAFSLIPYALFSILTVHLQCEEKFTFPRFCGFIVVNTVLLLSIFFADAKTGEGLAQGYVLAQMISFLLLLPYFLRNVKMQFIPDVHYARTKYSGFLKIAIPAGLVAMANRLNTASDAFFASMLGIGAASGLNYANKIQTLFLSFTTSVFMMVCIPRISRLFAQKDYDGGLQYVRLGLATAAFLSVPFASLLVAFGRQFVVLIFQRGSFDTTSTKITAACLSCYSLGIPFYTFIEVEARTLTAGLYQRLILKNTVIAVLLNIALDYILMKQLSYTGLALATSISGIVLFVLLLYELIKLGLPIADRDILSDIIKIFVASILSAMLARVLYVFLWKPVGAPAAFCSSIVTFAIVYLLQCRLCGIKILPWLVHRFV